MNELVNKKDQLTGRAGPADGGDATRSRHPVFFVLLACL